ITTTAPPTPALHTLSLHDALPIYAPAAELQLRDLMTVLYLGELTSLLDSPAAYQQMTRITELLPSVPEDKLRSQIYPGILVPRRSEEHTSELQSRGQLVCRLLLEK